MVTKKKNQDVLFEQKDKAFQSIKDNFDDFMIVDESDSFYIIAHKRTIETIRRIPTTFSSYEKEETKELCILSLVAFLDVPINKNMEEWLNLGCEHLYVEKNGTIEKVI